MIILLNTTSSMIGYKIRKGKVFFLFISVFGEIQFTRPQAFCLLAMLLIFLRVIEADAVNLFLVISDDALKLFVFILE